MNTATQTIDLKKSSHGGGLQPGYFARRDVWDWLFAALVLAAGAVAFWQYGGDGFPDQVVELTSFFVGDV